MADLTTATNTALLEGLKAGDRTLWQSYVDRYRPLIVSTGVRMGLRGDEAEDVAQVSLLEFSTGSREVTYDRSKGKLRSSLFGIVRNQIRQWIKRDREKSPPVGGTAAGELIDEIETNDDLEKIWDDEWQQAILKQCLVEIRREVHPDTFEAFRRFAVEGQSAKQVADALETTTNAVFLAKRRILARIRELTPLMGEIW